jgi:uncharacterized membrane protein YfcA
VILTPETVFLIVIAFVAAIVRGYSGFGFSAIVITAGSLFIPPSELVPVLYLLEIVASIHMIRSSRSALDVSLLRYVLLGCALALPIGQYLLVSLSADIIRLIVYLCVLICAVLVWRGYRLPSSMNNKLGATAGVLIGLGSGIGSVGGLPAMVIFLGTGYAVEKTRAIFVATFFALYVFGTLITLSNGLLNQAAWIKTGWLLIPLIVGVWCGEKYFSKSSAVSYRNFALGLMIVLASVGVVRVLLRYIL